ARPDARLRLVGPGSPEDLAAVRAHAARLGIAGAVTATGQVDDAGWDRHLSEAMVAVQLRASTNGEFSGAVAEALAAGIPTIVTALGSAAELPDDAAVKLPTESPPEALAAEILGLLSDPGRRKGLSEAARAYAASLSFESVAAELYGMLTSANRQNVIRTPGGPAGVRTPR
ncbi:MAG: hypothetical protein QOH66_2046, partial [Actinomycetota bacterium]|nr:hypothetical protein [Actinomycetota bacterium]